MAGEHLYTLTLSIMENDEDGGTFPIDVTVTLSGIDEHQALAYPSGSPLFSKAVEFLSLKLIEKLHEKGTFGLSHDKDD